MAYLFLALSSQESKLSLVEVEVEVVEQAVQEGLVVEEVLVVVVGTYLQSHYQARY